MKNVKTCWEKLEIEPTDDVKIIKKAYAKQAMLVHPEEKENQFLELRSAYEQALMLAKVKKTCFVEEILGNDTIRNQKNNEKMGAIYKSKLYEFSLN